MFCECGFGQKDCCVYGTYYSVMWYMQQFRMGIRKVAHWESGLTIHSPTRCWFMVLLLQKVSGTCNQAGLTGATVFIQSSYRTPVTGCQKYAVNWTSAHSSYNRRRLGSKIYCTAVNKGLCFSHTHFALLSVSRRWAHLHSLIPRLI